MPMVFFETLTRASVDRAKDTRRFPRTFMRYKGVKERLVKERKRQVAVGCVLPAVVAADNQSVFLRSEQKLTF